MRLRLLCAGLMLGVLSGCGMASEAKAPPPQTPAGYPQQQYGQPGSPLKTQANEAPKEVRFESDELTVSASGNAAGFQAPPAPPPPPPPQPSTTPARAPAATAAPQNRDFVIYTAQFTMAVYQVDTGIAAIEKIAQEMNGYLASKKDREIVIRIPRAQFNTAISRVDKVGDVLHRDIAALDVTDEHVDLEIRIKNARAMQKQLTDLLAKANVKEALEIEKELGRVTEELERLEGKLKLMNDKIAFSTITVTFEARGTTLQTQRVKLPFAWLGQLNLPTLLNLGEEK